MFLGLRQQSSDQAFAASGTLSRRIDGNGADFGQVWTIKMESAAADDVAVIFEDDEIANVFAHFSEAGAEVKFRHGSRSRSVRGSARHRAEGLHACAWTSSRIASTFCRASVMA